MTWRSSQLGENATDQDRIAIAETVQIQQDEARIEIIVQDELNRFTEFASDQEQADLLDQQADAADGRGDADEARRLRDQAVDLRQNAELLTFSGAASIGFANFVTTDPDTGRRTFAEDELRDALRQQSDSSQIDARATVEKAQDLRNRSQRMVAFTITLVAAVVLLTFAQLIGDKRARIGLLGLASGIWIVSSLVAFLGSA
jgi:hypothetical protein